MKLFFTEGVKEIPEKKSGLPLKGRLLMNQSQK
jgi:hypothetical protein